MSIGREGVFTLAPKTGIFPPTFLNIVPFSVVFLRLLPFVYCCHPDGVQYLQQLWLGFVHCFYSLSEMMRV